MKKKGVILYYVTAGYAALTLATGLYFLSAGTKPTADVEASYQNNLHSIWLGNWEPGEVRTFRIDGKPIVLWRRDTAEIAAAMEQFDPDISKEEWSKALNDGTLALEMGPETYNRLEWFIASPINVGGYGCIVLAKAGDYDGFLDPCQAVHFDMWGHPKKGPTTENLNVTPAQFSEDRQTVFLDLSGMPTTR
ncbi:ubiquinol cytochrome C oxidoreductase [Ruegeria sp. HKCCD8929]|uniref:ubiquinol cytochrome C oxidoreductase n=1 Tax=Ruegeria sp. HKCCD8929 TaxID=2683006 RepID=UPI001489A51C|nr:ubiquinol cytochrome C oxidoreductase [Ruegeria sp. HKCCD8929]